MAINKLQVIILLLLQLLNHGMSFSNDKITCKYYLIEYASFNRLISSSNYIYKLYHFESRHVRINEAYFRIIHNEFCLNKTSIDQVRALLLSTNSFIFGIDLGNNNLNKHGFDFIMEYHEDELRNIRYLNLNSNNITSISNHMFPNLESLILDRNLYLEDLNFNKLKLISLNKCNLNEKTNLTIKLVKNQTLVYLGLAENKLTDMTSATEVNAFSLFDCLVSLNIDLFDLSFNRFHKLTTVKYLLARINSIKKINLEKNLFSLFNINEILVDKQNQQFKSTEINLKFNFIRNTSLVYFRSTKINPKITIKLYGNPLVCDCNSMWLLDEMHLLNNKTRLISRREIEEISSHHNLDGLNFGFHRQKRIKSQHNKQSNRSIVQINDLELLKCNFIDVQNYDSHSQYDNDEFNFDLELKKQNILVKSIKYREKYISMSSHEDFMCYYEDHCRASECDCCVFKHCHCRSICPRQCRCYFDSTLMQNIIDCSSLNLIDVPNTPIETATDMRLNSNTLKMLNSHTFFGFGQLKYLYLQNNQISFIAPDSFEDLKYSLKLLNLAENKLTYLNGDEFYGLNELAILVLNGNPLKDIDNINFIDSSHLPSLRLFYLADTTLPAKKLNELVQYSKKSTNISIRHQMLPQHITTISSNIIQLSTNYSEHVDLNYSSNSTRSKLLNKYIFYQFKLLNWYYFPLFVFVVCLLLSLVIVFTVVIVARKYETDSNSSSSNTSSASTSSSTAQLKRKSNRLNNKRSNRCCCATYRDELKQGDYSFSSHSYEQANIIKVGGLTNEYQDIKQPFLLDSCLGTLLCRRSPSNTTSSSFDSKLDNDLISVPVSRSIENLNLNVNIYFNIVDNDYIANYLLSCLKKCLTIVPDTKFILKPQTTAYVQVNHELNVNTSPKHSNANLVANILVISDNFYGFQPLADSLISLRCNNNKTNLTSMQAGNNSSSGISSNSSTIYQDEIKCYLMNTTMFDSHLQNIFKIYLNLDDTHQKQQVDNKTLIQKDSLNLFNSSKTYSLNQRLMKRLYETSTTSDNRISMHIQNDISSSYAFSDKLQCKLEKYFQNICFKSSKFSENNFSYVDYSKR